MKFTSVLLVALATLQLAAANSATAQRRSNAGDSRAPAVGMAGAPVLSASADIPPPSRAIAVLPASWCVHSTCARLPPGGLLRAADPQNCSRRTCPATPCRRRSGCRGSSPRQPCPSWLWQWVISRYACPPFYGLGISLGLLI